MIRNYHSYEIINYFQAKKNTNDMRTYKIIDLNFSSYNLLYITTYSEDPYKRSDKDHKIEIEEGFHIFGYT